jgi:hypothetical protein
VTYEAEHDIVANADNTTFDVKPGSNVIMHAGHAIDLNPGFTADYDYYAYIDPFTACTNTYHRLAGTSSNSSILNNHTIDELIDIYPNPSTGILHLRSKSSNSNKIFITDISDKIIWQSEHDLQIEEDENIDLSYLPRGVYIVKFVNDKKVTAKRIVLI